LSIRIVADASLHAMQGAGERIPPNPTGAGLIRTAEPRKIRSSRSGEAHQRHRPPLANSLEDAVFRLVKPHAYACDAASSGDVETA
jgi:hypothetical protein